MLYCSVIIEIQKYSSPVKALHLDYIFFGHLLI